MVLDFTLCRSYEIALERRSFLFREPFDQAGDHRRQVLRELVRGVYHHLTSAANPVA
jgi:hypothetical protein